MHRFLTQATNISIVNPEPVPDRWNRKVILPLVTSALQRRAWSELPSIYVLPHTDSHGAQCLRIDNERTNDRPRAHLVLALAKRAHIPVRVFAAKGAWAYHRQFQE